MAEEKIIFQKRNEPKSGLVDHIAVITKNFTRIERQAVGYIGRQETLPMAVNMSSCAAVKLVEGRPVSVVVATKSIKDKGCILAVATAVESRGKGYLKDTFRTFVDLCISDKGCRLKQLVADTENDAVRRVCWQNGLENSYSSPDLYNRYIRLRRKQG
jgi:hypothetical protein